MTNNIHIFFLTVILIISCSKDDANKLKEKNEPYLNYSQLENKIDYYIKKFERNYGDCETDANCIRIKLEYPEIITPGNSNDSVNAFINNRLLKAVDYVDNYSNFEELSDRLITSYMLVQKEFEDYETGWFLERKIYLINLNQNILSLSSEETIYTGGANTGYNFNYINFNTEEGTIISIDDLVKKDEMNELLLVGETNFRKLKKIPKNLSLESAGFWFDDNVFQLNDNFTVTDSGLVFFYNLYEIAPRSEGITKLVIPSKDVRDLLINSELVSHKEN